MTAHPVIYGKFLTSLYQAKVNFTSDPMYCMLCSNGYTPNQDTHQFLSDISHEVVGSGYFAGGQAVTGIDATYTGSTKKLVVSAGNLNWPSVTFSAAYAVLYMKSPQTATLQPLIGYVDFGGTQSPANQAFYINWPTSGILSMQVPT